MKSIKQIKNLKNKKVLVRLDLNVPISNGVIEDDIRIKKALPTIKYLKSKGAKIILISHLGRDAKDSLDLVADLLNKYIKITFIPEIFGSRVEDALYSMKGGEIILLENLRSHSGEKDNDMKFAKTLASFADIYVNEAFPVSHRNDASIVGVPKYLPSYAGLQFADEIKHLSFAVKPSHPFLVIFGGAKTETKIPLIKRYLKEADNVFVGGALANNFLKAKGFEIGNSVVDYEISKLKSFVKSSKLILPISVVVDREGKKDINIEEINPSDSILDIGNSSIKNLEDKIKKAKLILWNGPLGWYEKGYTEGTEALIKTLLKSKGKVIIGGGDTSVFIERKNLANKFTFTSTGGGATLEFLSKGTLPGIKALK